MEATGHAAVRDVTTKPSGTSLTASRWLIHTVCSHGVPANSSDSPAVASNPLTSPSSASRSSSARPHAPSSRCSSAAPYSPTSVCPTEPPSATAMACCP